MIKYIQLAFTIALLVLLLPIAIDYLRLRHLLTSNYKLLTNKMSELKLPSITTPTNTDLLTLIAASGESKKYFGKEYTVKDIEAMTADDQEILKQRYEAKFGNEVIKTVGNSLSSIYMLDVWA